MIPNPDEVEAALDAANIRHGVMVLQQVSNNISFSDGSQVFVKITRPGFSPEQLRTELQLATHYGPEIMLEPLAADVLPVGSSFMSVWRYEELEQLHPRTLPPESAAELAVQLNRLHELSLPPFPLVGMKNFSLMQDVIVRRVAFGEAHGLESHYTKLMLQLSQVFLSGQVPEADFVLNHGDPHVGNAANRLRAGKPTWLDYESARLAPPEFDAATLKVNLLLLGENEAAWLAAEKILDEVGLQPEMMELFTRSRLISMTSYVMLLPEHHNIVRERLDLLEPILSGEPLPSRFPNER